MTYRNYIRIDGLEEVDNRCLSYNLSYSDGLKRYFYSDRFYVKYDKELNNVDKGVSYIPGVGCLVTLCWATGSDLYLEELDSNFLNSLYRVRDVLNRFYPDVNFRGDIHVGKESNSEGTGNRTGLLFSGGVDSTSIYIKEIAEKPDLFTIIGGIIPLENTAFIQNFKETYTDFAQRENLLHRNEPERDYQ